MIGQTKTTAELSTPSSRFEHETTVAIIMMPLICIRPYLDAKDCTNTVDVPCPMGREMQ
jgi:hypothetical protein